MFRTVDTRDAVAVEREVQAIFAAQFPDGDRGIVTRAFEWATGCFAGRHQDYGPIDALYHDLEHTLQGTLCLMRLLHGRHLAGVMPALSVRNFELVLVAILFHDTGYLKRRDDTEGTGAKYTVIHVERSAEFAGAFLESKGFSHAEILAVQNMIKCTGINADLQAIPFQSDLERTLGYALATADLLGQMAADDYVAKLPVLFDELAEAARFEPAGLPPGFAFASVDDLIRSTPGFWDHYVRPKIEGDFRGLYAFLGGPGPDGANPYLQQIEEGIAGLKRRLATTPS